MGSQLIGLFPLLGRCRRSSSRCRSVGRSWCRWRGLGSSSPWSDSEEVAEGGEEDDQGEEGDDSGEGAEDEFAAGCEAHRPAGAHAARAQWLRKPEMMSSMATIS